MNNNIVEIRTALIEKYQMAETETEKMAIRADLMATMTDRERAIYADNARIATEICALRHNFKAVEARYDEAVAMAEVMGYPVSEKVKTLSGEFTVQINTTKDILDVEKLKADCEVYKDIAKGVKLAVETKRAKVSVDTLSITDLKGVLKDVPKKAKREVRVMVKDA